MKFSEKLMVDPIIYNRLGPEPTKEKIELLLDEYRIRLVKEVNSSVQLRCIVDRLEGALQGESLYADWHKRFCKQVQKISKQS
jgi:hypothetical protein